MDAAIEQSIQKIAPSVVALQERIHRDPELSNQERRTREKICDFLSDSGLRIIESRETFGLIAELELDPAWRTIAFRADMDALPIQEKTSLPYASENPGIMHACGHDFHTAILAGTARALAKMKEKLIPLRRNLRFVFQPAEENNPVGGSRQMISEGALKDCEAIFGLHVWPALDTGSLTVTAGPVMAASDRVTITIGGKSSHAARPEAGIDTIAVAGEMISSLNTIVSRKINPMHPAVITLGRIEGGDRYNIIAEKTTLEGTVRNLYEPTRELIEASIRKIAAGVADSFGATATVDYVRGYPVTENDPALASWASAVLKDSMGEGHVLENELPAMTAEDFGFYAREVPALFMWLGCASPDLPEEDRAPLHNSAFSADQGCIGAGIRALTSLALAPGQ